MAIKQKLPPRTPRKSTRHKAYSKPDFRLQQRSPHTPKRNDPQSDTVRRAKIEGASELTKASGVAVDLRHIFKHFDVKMRGRDTTTSRQMLQLVPGIIKPMRLGAEQRSYLVPILLQLIISLKILLWALKPKGWGG